MSDAPSQQPPADDTPPPNAPLGQPAGDGEDGELGPSLGQATVSTAKRLRHWIVGDARNPFDPTVFHQVALIAFFAWVGLGADGLSSACYGPEEAYRALEAHHGLALYLALATMVTVVVISASYFQIIDLFPSGGGGYLVATKLLGSTFGLVAGCALIVDYALTIATSVASSLDAIFSMLPLAWHPFRIPSVFLAIIILTALNLRGAKESIKVLTPIFMLFVLTHIALLAAATFGHPAQLLGLPTQAVTSLNETVGSLGAMGTMLMLFRAYSLGAGTYTGIEAVSNGLEILREPRTQTGKRTMIYMAISLSLTASLLLIAYLIHNVKHEPGRTLNATLAQEVMSGWHIGALPVGSLLVLLTLLSEGAILLVAAQTGYVSGPRVLANMAIDKWVPRRFANLSERLVTQDGVLLMAGIAAGMLIYTRTSVHTLLVMYSINVFITFVLTQLGMVRHWWEVRATERGWLHRLVINSIGLALCIAILIVTVGVKFGQGGWVTLIVTGSAIGLCWVIRRHYRRVARYTERLDAILTSLPVGRHASEEVKFNPQGRTAILLVDGFNGLGMHTFLSVLRMFPGDFTNFVFLEVGVLDFGRWKGVKEVEAMREATVKDLQRYVEHANGLGLWATARADFGIEVIDTASRLCKTVAKEMPKPMFFSGRLVYREENLVSRTLHGQTALALQRRLHFAGLPLIILPIRAM